MIMFTKLSVSCDWSEYCDMGYLCCIAYRLSFLMVLSFITDYLRLSMVLSSKKVYNQKGAVTTTLPSTLNKFKYPWLWSFILYCILLLLFYFTHIENIINICYWSINWLFLKLSGTKFVEFFSSASNHLLIKERGMSNTLRIKS